MMSSRLDAIVDTPTHDNYVFYQDFIVLNSILESIVIQKFSNIVISFQLNKHDLKVNNQIIII